MNKDLFKSRREMLDNPANLKANSNINSINSNTAQIIGNDYLDKKGNIKLY